MPVRICRRTSRGGLRPIASSVPDTDWHVDKLYSFVRDSGATLIAATHSRVVIDLNRDPTGAALYPGADNTELCPVRTFGNDAIYADGVELERKRSNFVARSISIPIMRHWPRRSRVFDGSTAT
jgi:N-formylglutamate amidohydrolase